MISRQRLIFLALVLAVTCIGSTLTARADSITSNTIVVVQGTIAAGANNTVSAGIFTFVIPVGQTITAANLVGSSQYDLRNGAQIGLVLESSLITNISGLSASSPINVALAPSLFSALADGTAALDLNRLGGTFGGSYNLFSLQLQLTTGPAGTAPVLNQQRCYCSVAVHLVWQQQPGVVAEILISIPLVKSFAALANVEGSAFANLVLERLREMESNENDLRWQI